MCGRNFHGLLSARVAAKRRVTIARYQLLTFDEKRFPIALRSSARRTGWLLPPAKRLTLPYRPSGPRVAPDARRYYGPAKEAMKWAHATFILIPLNRAAG